MLQLIVTIVLIMLIIVYTVLRKRQRKEHNSGILDTTALPNEKNIMRPLREANERRDEDVSDRE